MELRDLKGPPEAHNVERIAYLFRQVPPMIGASLIGIFLVFVFLFESVGADPLKAWAAYMLSVLGIGVWLWSMHRNAVVTPLTVRRWEYAIIMDNLRRRVQSENLLSEQQTIFQSTSQGIALVGQRRPHRQVQPAAGRDSRPTPAGPLRAGVRGTFRRPRRIRADGRRKRRVIQPQP